MGADRTRYRREAELIDTLHQFWIDVGGGMKLYWSSRSPQARKVMIVAHEARLVDRIDRVRTLVDPLQPNAALMLRNPLSKIPTLVLDDGRVLYDSSVICEYLDSLHNGTKLLPDTPDDKLAAQRRQALGDGFVEFLLLLRNERARAQPSQQLLAAFATKRQAVLDHLEAEGDQLAQVPLTVGHIAIGCALSYLDFRFAGEQWRSSRPRIARWHDSFRARPSVQATEFVDAH